MTAAGAGGAAGAVAVAGTGAGAGAAGAGVGAEAPDMDTHVGHHVYNEGSMHTVCGSRPALDCSLAYALQGYMGCR